MYAIVSVPRGQSYYVDYQKIVDIKQKCSRCTLVFQEPFLLKGTILDNILLNRNDEAFTADAARIAETLGLHRAIMRLPNGYDTMISEDSSPFSKGEKQLLCVVRALAKRPKILILDEATANMDSETQKNW